MESQMSVRLLRFKDLKEYGGPSNWPTLKRWVELYGYPAGRYLGQHVRVWTEEEALAWFESRPPANAKAPGAVAAAAEGRKPKPPLSPSAITESAVAAQDPEVC
jgi:hypothetical protein